MKMQTKDLQGAALDWAVIVALYGKHDGVVPAHITHFKKIRSAHPAHQQGHYSTSWAHGGPIIEQEGIDLMKVGIHQWRADCGPALYGPTPLIAAMRAFVASKLGAEVEIPEGLL